MLQNEGFGKRIRARRDQLELKQENLAEACGTTQSILSRIEAGKITQIKPDLIMKIANALQTSTDYLLGTHLQLHADPILRTDRNAQILIHDYSSLSVRQSQLLLQFADFLSSGVKDAKQMRAVLVNAWEYLGRLKVAGKLDGNDPDYVKIGEYMAGLAIDLAIAQKDMDNNLELPH